jgi:2-desacetyl-2-hydroxyethyl bacteriochlorophyllide A dehydrogenase
MLYEAGMETAQRWLFRGRQDVVCEEISFDPSRLGPREVAVRTEFTVISAGTECAYYLGNDPRALQPGQWGAYPWNPGYTGIGRVLAVGAEVGDYRAGERVVGRFPHRSHTVIEAGDRIAPAHPDVKPEHAAWIGILSICMTPMQMLRNDPLPSVGVWGQGIIGNLVGQLLRRAGGRVVGIDPLAARRQLSRRCGIRDTLDPSDARFAGAVNDLTRGEGFDIGIDTTGAAAVTLSVPAQIRRRGQMVLMTHWRSQPVVDASEFIEQIFRKGIELHGAHETAPHSEPWSRPGVAQQRNWRKLQHELATGGLAIDPLISHVIKPGQCKQAYDGLCFDREHWWGVVVDWRD